MDFELTDQQKMIKKVVSDFAEKEVEPIAAEIDETCEFPYENVEKMGEAHMLGIPVPQEYGGAGADTLSYAITVEELSKACGTHGIICSAHTSLACDPLVKYGTKEQKEKYLKPLAKGELLGAYALTEPNAGTDAASQKTTAKLDGDEYVLNGNKIFITNAGAADVFIVFAMTDKSKGTRGISGFIVEADTPGFTLGKKEDKMGINASDTRELIFDDCRVPKENLLGEEGKGFKIAMGTLDGGRIGVAAQALGIAQRALDETVQYVKEREQFNRAISKFQNTQFKIAEMETKIQAARSLVYQAAFAKDQGGSFSKEAAMAKYYASDVAMEVTREAIQLHGGYGYMKEYPIERLFRDAKITEIYEGTTEVQKMVIGGSLLR
ncbi:acyl-CoA dehydrogenase [Halanaerobacter jeridensis]|uniref:Butyryl-CoA dehydrogenase n=1 Tax=Halanaerobacter jeridensis TaxID=706427 RepID=A0A938XWB3_9FIRM|nr:acyl-CoA dehydrogenase [Halanaerobacter jeridensis]MBM7556817.1 butyryl-CoA dehydrogenase [Halanaerobacter jeridensis]